MLDKDKLKILQREFSKHPDGLSEKTFVRLMKGALEYKSEEKYDIVLGLHRLFAEIDIDGNRKMEWREFTQYVIDAVMQDTILTGSRNQKPNQKELLELAYSEKFVRFSESSHLDGCLHEGLIQKAIYIKSIDKIMLIESQTHLIKFLSTNLKLKDSINLYSRDLDWNTQKELSEEEKVVLIKDEKVFVLSAAIDQQNNILGCVCGNKTMQFFTIHNCVFKRTTIKKCCEVQYGIWYMKKHRAWITSSRKKELQQDEIILKKQLEKDDYTWGKAYFNDWTYKISDHLIKLLDSIYAHSAQIMDIVEIYAPRAIVTCSLDHSIKLWDLSTGNTIGSFTPEHKTGVRCLDYTPDFNGSIISVAHEMLIKVYFNVKGSYR